MILFDLICSQGHGFEAWFRDGESFDRLVAVGEIQCAVCGDRDVRKALMAPNISTSKNADARAAQARADETSSQSSDAKDKQDVKPPQGAPATMAVQEKPGPLKGSDSMPVPEKVAEAMQVLRQVQNHIEKTFDHVGRGFAEEARKMHYGEAEQRSIYGEATNDEAQELIEEGIEVNQMPWLPRRDS